MEKDFLYIDILGFSQMVREHSAKIPQVFKIIDELSVHRHYAFRAIVFSDTIIVYNDNDEMPNHYYVTYLIEFAQQLFYRLLSIGVFFRGLITYGEFEFHKLGNIQAYWGSALIEAYNDENKKDNNRIKGFGLFVEEIYRMIVLSSTKYPLEKNTISFFFASRVLVCIKRLMVYCLWI